MKGKILLINATFMAAVENKVALPGTRTLKSGQFICRRRMMSVAAPRLSYITYMSYMKLLCDKLRPDHLWRTSVVRLGQEMEKEVLQHNNASNNPDVEATCMYGGFKLLKWKLLCIKMD